MKTLTFTVADGKVELEASGFTGGACEVASKAFEEALGGPISNKKRKAEYNKTATTTTVNAGSK